MPFCDYHLDESGSTNNVATSPVSLLCRDSYRIPHSASNCIPNSDSYSTPNSDSHGVIIACEKPFAAQFIESSGND